MNLQRKGRYAFIMLAVICILLSVALIITITKFQNYKKNAVIEVVEPVKETDEMPKENVVSVDSLKEYAQKYNVSAEFLQRFFDDVIVYKDANGIVYEPINHSLPKNSFDFNNLVHVNGQIEYHENGVSKGIKGIDVSKHQGDIDWKKVKADGVEFAILRLGYRGYGTGKIMIDEYFHKNMKEALRAGVEVGVYFFSQAISIEEAVEEANIVIHHLKDYQITYPVIFDAEEIVEDDARTKSLTIDEQTDITLAFCDTVKNAGYKPMIYANIKWFVAHLDLSRLTMYDKWFAQYFKTPFFPYDFQMWQYTSKGRIDGIKGDVDLNICFKNYAIDR